MSGEDDSAKRSQTGVYVDVPRDFIKCGSSPGPFTIVTFGRFVPLEKFTQGGRKTTIRDRRMAKEFLKERGNSHISDSALMQNIGEREKPKIGRSASIAAIERGCKALIRQCGVSDLINSVDQGRVNAYEAAAIAQLPETEQRNRLAALQRKKSSGNR